MSSVQACQRSRVQPYSPMKMGSTCGSRAAAGAGMVPRWFRVVGSAGAAALITAALLELAVTPGVPALMVGLVGFLTRVLFLLVFGARLRRRA